MVDDAGRRSVARNFPSKRLARAVASVSPLAFTALLTAAVFILPAPGETGSAHASATGKALSFDIVQDGRTGSVQR